MGETNRIIQFSQSESQHRFALVNIETRALDPSFLQGSNQSPPILKDFFPIMERLRFAQVVGIDSAFLRSGSVVHNRDQVRWGWDRNVAKLDFDKPPVFTTFATPGKPTQEGRGCTRRSKERSWVIPREENQFTKDMDSSVTRN